MHPQAAADRTGNPSAARPPDPPSVHSPHLGVWKRPLVIPGWPAMLLSAWCLSHAAHHGVVGLTFFENSTHAAYRRPFEVAAQSWPLAALLVLLGVGIAAERAWARRGIQFLLGYRILLHLIPPVWHIFPFAGPPMFRVLLNSPKSTALLFAFALWMRFRGEARGPLTSGLSLMLRRLRGWFVSPSDARCTSLGPWRADPVLRADAVRGRSTPLASTLAHADFADGPWCSVGTIDASAGSTGLIAVRFLAPGAAEPVWLASPGLSGTARLDVQYARYREPWGTRVLRVRVWTPGASPFAVAPLRKIEIHGATRCQVGDLAAIPIPFPSGVCRVSEFRDADRVFGLLLEFLPPARNTPEP